MQSTLAWIFALPSLKNRVFLEAVFEWPLEHASAPLVCLMKWRLEECQSP